MSHWWLEWWCDLDGRGVVDMSIVDWIVVAIRPVYILRINRNNEQTLLVVHKSSKARRVHRCKLECG